MGFKIPQRERAAASRFNANDRSTVEQVLEATNIVEIVGEVVALNPRKQSNEFIGLCPFHTDGTPSFEVSASKQMYSCWSCSAGLNGSRGGDAITFVRRYLNMDFKEAVNYLAQRTRLKPVYPGMEGRHAQKFQNLRPAAKFAPPKASIDKNQKDLIDLSADPAALKSVMARAQEFFGASLAGNPAANEYLSERGLNPELFARYRIGFAPDGFGALKGVFADYASNASLINAGLVRKSPKGISYDFFRDRITFAVRDALGDIVAFGGRRRCDAQVFNAQNQPVKIPKYINSPETAIFSKSEHLFGWYEAKPFAKAQNTAIVVEGYMDVLGLAGQGINHAVACMGTALTQTQVERLFAEVDRVVFCFDGDEAGQTAAFRSLGALVGALRSGKSVAFLTLPQGKDPDEYVRAHGPSAFLALTEKAQSLLEFWPEIFLKIYPGPDQQTRLWENAMTFIREIDLDVKTSNGDSLIADLTQITAKITPNAVKKTPDSLGGSVRFKPSGFQANDPSERLYIAVNQAALVAAQIRPELVRMQQNLPPNLISEIAQWQAKFDCAMREGFDRGNLAQPTHSDARHAQYEAIVRAAPSVLSHYLKTRAAQLLEQARDEGQIDGRDYLDKLRHHGFFRPN